MASVAIVEKNECELVGYFVIGSLVFSCILRYLIDYLRKRRKEYNFFSDKCCNFGAKFEVEYIITLKEPRYVRKNTRNFKALYHSKSFDW